MHPIVSIKFLSIAGLYVFVSPQLSLAEAPDFTPIQKEIFSIAGSFSNAWADFDNDGDLDFAVSTREGAVLLYQNDRSTFVEVGRAHGLPVEGDEIRGLSWGDYDNDGDVDLLAGSAAFPAPGKTFVFRNDGGKMFTEVGKEIGLSMPHRHSRQANWIDYDNDGDLDLYAADRALFSTLYQNTTGQFSAVPSGVGPTDPRRSVGTCWFDMDTDGDLDLIVTNQAGDSDGVWRNDGAKFTDIGSELGMDQTMRQIQDGGVGCAVGDYDNDGDFDLYVATYGDNLLYRNEGDGNFTEVAEAFGVTGPTKSVGAAWGDFDNDGDLDLFVVGYGDGQRPTNELYENTEDGFKNVLPTDASINAADHGVEWIDYDGDGDIDLSLTDGYGPEGGHFLFRNELAMDQRRNSLSVLVLDASGHFTRPGAEVRVRNQSGEILGSRLVSTGGGYNTQSATPVYFGLPSDQAVTIEVRFMGPNGGHTQTLNGIVPSSNANKPLEIREDRN